jgi:hypothetical protein
MNADVKKLRAMLLLAVAGCGTEPSKPRRPHRHHHHHDNSEARVAIDAPAPVAPKPEECDADADTIFETICSPSSKTCRSTDSLGFFDLDEAASKLFVTSRRDGGADLVFTFDEDVTDRYRMAHDGNGCCYARCTHLQVAPATSWKVPYGFVTNTVYIPMPKGGTLLPAAREPRCPAAVRFGEKEHPFVSARDERCGYGFLERDPATLPARGRAARVDGTARYVDVEPVDDAIAAYWIDVARAEHASIAAFGNLSLQLLALGAPSALLAATHAAALDEIRHARDAFAIASRFAGRSIEAGAFADAARMSARISLRELAVETFVDGCIAEARAAIEAERAALEAEPSIADVLCGVGADEARHAALAWSILAWCLDADPSISAALPEHVSRARSVALGDRRPQPHYGILGTEQLESIRDEVLAIVEEILAHA